MPAPPLSYPLLVFLGGGVGAVLRYGLGEWVRQFEWLRHFPWVTLGINAVGSFALGMIATATAGTDRTGWRVLLGTGLCGGFTTFSTFSVETLQMWEQQRYAAAAGYVAGSVTAALLGAWAGWRLVKG